MSEVPNSAKIVIIGQGGIVGASLAHHLKENGWDGIVGLDKSAIPTDIGSTSHASDFCFSTSHDKLLVFTTTYSQRFYEARGHYVKCGGMEVARFDDDARMEELKRKVGSGKAFGTNVSLISPREAGQRFPLLDERGIQGAMWDPDAGLVVPQSAKVAGELIEEAQSAGALEVYPHTPVTHIEVDRGRVRGVHTAAGFIESPIVVSCVGMWGPVVGEMAGERVPLMPVEHPLLFFGPVESLKGAGGVAGSEGEICYPLFRDQGNSSYVRDTGDPTTAGAAKRGEGGMLEWGYYEQYGPRLVDAHHIRERREGQRSPSQNELDLHQVLHAFHRAWDLIPALSELEWQSESSFNGLLSMTPDGGALMGESPNVRGLWMGESIWIKDGPGMGKLLADWLTRGMPHYDPHGVDIARFYPVQTHKGYVWDRCYETAQKIYDPPVHPREPYQRGRNLRRSAFWQREVELGGYFMEAGGWERAHGYQANETRLADYLAQVPERPNEWDSRHFWRVANAEHLAMSDHAGMINLSHFAIFDVVGPDAEHLLEHLSVARVGGVTPIGKAVYTNFLDTDGGIRADLTITRLGERHYRVVSGGDTGHRDLTWIRNTRDDQGCDAEIWDQTESLATLALWGPKAREILMPLAEEPEALSNDAFRFATARPVTVCGVETWALRLSYVGELGWELYCPFPEGVRLWDGLFDAGAVPVGIETYASSRRLEKSLRLQNADLETEYNLCEAGLARPKVKPAEFLGKQAHLAHREREQQPAYLCTMTMDEHLDANGVPRYPVGQWPILDPHSKDVLIDSRGRRSYLTSAAYGPSVGDIILMGYLPSGYAREGHRVTIEYFGEHYPATVVAVGYRPLYDPKNERVKA